MGHKKSPREAGSSFTQAQLDAATAARDRAAAGTPAQVRSAFLAQPIVVGAITVPVLTMGKVLVLEEIGSPLAQPGSAAPTNEQVIEALFALSSPAEAMLAVWNRGKAAWRAQVFAFGDTIPLSDIPALGAALGAQLAQAESTVIGSSSNSDSPASSGEEAGPAGVSKKNDPRAPVTSPTPSTASPPTPTG